ncbi:MAG: hypothetical protein ACOC2F_04520 [Bacteroidota bacterium]
MSKKQILEQVYIDEVEYIYEEKRQKELQRYTGYLNQIMAAAAGSGAGGKTAKNYVQDVIEHIKKLSSDEEKEQQKDKSITELYYEKKELEEKEELSQTEKEKLAKIETKIDELFQGEIGKFKSMTAPGGAENA